MAFKLRNKYHAQQSVYNGTIYHSKKEAEYAAQLDLRVRAGELKEWKRQIRLPLLINGYKVCDYICDFVEIYPDGHEAYREIKGYPSPVGELKAKMVRACYPKMDFAVIR